jgi:uncharacterized protein (DUF2141 family)
MPDLAKVRVTGVRVAAVLAFLLAANPTRAALVQINVTGVADARGHVRVELCTKDTFLTTACPYRGDAPASVGSTLVTVENVPPGQYAAQVFHDETDEGVVHQNLLGIPREKIGFSNDAPLHFRGPLFKDAAFKVGDEIQRVTLKLRKLVR